MLEWIGDIGGLFDGLTLLVGKFIAPIAAFALQAELLTLNFRQVETEDSSKVHRRAYRIILPSCLCFDKKKNRYRKMLERANSTISK